ncbi:XPG/Rad2 endonuclease like protein [Aduncisulcus paluster]|uniref:XPG/Rad2 endonuclease like protein n=1 Tax=Aduncisulcus paluster TaxID=2918883 RepID=A0ABQ5KLV5_9EUKA|nr:XPG/Rad2 endonuclease like protein [Aduncisulcus paluster]
MGVKGLWSIFRHTEQIIDDRTLPAIQGLVVAVDMSIWLHKTLRGTRGNERLALKSFVSFVSKFLDFGLLPIFVFDGRPPRQKYFENLNRTLKQHIAKQKRDELSVQKEMMKYLQAHKTLPPMESMESLKSFAQHESRLSGVNFLLNTERSDSPMISSPQSISSQPSSGIMIGKRRISADKINAYNEGYAFVSSKKLKQISSFPTNPLPILTSPKHSSSDSSSSMAFPSDLSDVWREDFDVSHHILINNIKPVKGVTSVLEEEESEIIPEEKEKKGKPKHKSNHLSPFDKDDSSFPKKSDTLPTTHLFDNPWHHPTSFDSPSKGIAFPKQSLSTMNHTSSLLQRQTMIKKALREDHRQSLARTRDDERGEKIDIERGQSPSQRSQLVISQSISQDKETFEPLSNDDSEILDSLEEIFQPGNIIADKRKDMSEDDSLDALFQDTNNNANEVIPLSHFDDKDKPKSESSKDEKNDSPSSTPSSVNPYQYWSSQDDVFEDDMIEALELTRDSIVHDKVSVSISSRVDQITKQLSKEEDKEIARAIILTNSFIDKCKLFLSFFGLPVFCAPAEAEAQCVALVNAGLCSCVLSTDSDCFMFGAEFVMSEPLRRHTPSHVLSIFGSPQIFGLTKAMICAFAVLCGCDYVGGIKGVGHVKGLELLCCACHGCVIDDSRELLDSCGGILTKLKEIRLSFDSPEEDGRLGKKQSKQKTKRQKHKDLEKWEYVKTLQKVDSSKLIFPNSLIRSMEYPKISDIENVKQELLSWKRARNKSQEDEEEIKDKSKNSTLSQDLEESKIDRSEPHSKSPQENNASSNPTIIDLLATSPPDDMECSDQIPFLLPQTLFLQRFGNEHLRDGHFVSNLKPVIAKYKRNIKKKKTNLKRVGLKYLLLEGELSKREQRAVDILKSLRE